jgi:Uma2 family endonuclease
LVIEVRSKNDSLPYLHQKVQTYLQAGVGQVWIADPKAKTVEIHARQALVRMLSQEDTITEANFPFIPGLKIVLAEVFAE